MPNEARGETVLVVDGAPRAMRLTLGGLAALEVRLETGGLIALAERFETGRFSADDLIAILAEGLRGAGENVSDGDVSDLNFEGGAIGAAEAASRLLAASFRGVS